MGAGAINVTPHREEQYIEHAGGVIEVLASRIPILLGDRVTVVASAYDPRRGRIVHRG